MFEFILASGKVGVIGIIMIFVVVFFLAAPGKEISFWGIKFYKKHRLFSPIRWRRIPKPLPQDWLVVLQTFAIFDDHHLHQDKIFVEANRIANFSVLKSREVIAEMQKYGLFEHLMNHVLLKDGALSLVSEAKNKYFTESA